MLPRIIDDHLNKNNVSMLQDHIIDIFILQRESYYSRFAQEISKANSPGMIDAVTLDRLKKAWVAEKQSNVKLAADNTLAINMIKRLVSRVQELEAAQAKCIPAPAVILAPPALTVPPTVMPMVPDVPVVQPREQVLIPPVAAPRPDQPKSILRPSPPVMTLIDDDPSATDDSDDESVHARRMLALRNRSFTPAPAVVSEIDSADGGEEAGVADEGAAVGGSLFDDPWG